MARARQRALEILRRHGRQTTSFQTLEPHVRYRFYGPDAFMAYSDTGAAWVGAGHPVAPPEALAEIASQFVAEAARAGRRACFFAVDEQFVHQAGLRSLPIGQEPTWDPHRWPQILQGSRNLRQQLRRARAKCVTVRELSANEVGGRNQEELNQLASRWLSSHALAPMGFLVELDLFSHAAQRRYFVAHQRGRLVGALIAVPVFARGGWLVEDLLRDRDTPNGTIELLLDALMTALAEQGCTLLSLGLAPLAGQVHPWLRTIRRWTRALYNFDGVHAFKSKLRPTQWHPRYLAYPAGRWPVVAIADSLSAFAEGGLWRFGLRTSLQLWRPLTMTLIGLLLPWMLLLAASSPARWSSPTAQWAWVVFDGALAVVLGALLRRPSTLRLNGLCLLLALDLSLSCLEALRHAAPNARNLSDWLLIALAVLGPGLALSYYGLLRRAWQQAPPADDSG